MQKSGTCFKIQGTGIYPQMLSEIIMFLRKKFGNFFTSEEILANLSSQTRAALITTSTTYRSRKRSPFRNPASFVGGAAAELARSGAYGIYHTTARCSISGRKAAAFGICFVGRKRGSSGGEKS